MKIACGIATLLFIAFMCLQFNDAEQYKNGDWWSWVIFYAATAIVSLVVGLGKCRSVATIMSFAGFALGSFVFKMQDANGNFEFHRFAGRGWFRSEDTKEMVQQTNEAGGLLIVAIWLFVLAFLLVRQQKAGDSEAKTSNMDNKA